MLSADDLTLVAALHGGFPLSDRPYAEAATRLGCSEDVLIERLQRLLAHGDLTRFGPLFQIERAGGRFVLAAMAVPEARFSEVAQLLRDMPEIAHNYRRESALPATTTDIPLNMWFVIAVGSAQEVPRVVERIEQASALTVFQFPKEQEYFVELRLPLTEPHHATAR
mgnify:CR=1 FL=1